ncbi:pentatricopeptide repeat-containing protein At4g02750 [Selaginella moellendorffii]|uniref:pentatricopeptide repeat-containing protein At4g02750 n=1 Tax=Selaginella moellendorffii TaxID=88036 RepID=UPI000D1C9AF6|nr:pentatricopeptide repeat-containing protein At4g02750 [Selaginella moellendorffii]|eukprot:XP_024531150.1 pentatricopeptide repeat-containing protein At4g02750 [Selaginella moellendorffii]
MIKMVSSELKGPPCKFLSFDCFVQKVSDKTSLFFFQFEMWKRKTWNTTSRLLQIVPRSEITTRKPKSESLDLPETDIIYTKQGERGYGSKEPTKLAAGTIKGKFVELKKISQKHVFCFQVFVSVVDRAPGDAVLELRPIQECLASLKSCRTLSSVREQHKQVKSKLDLENDRNLYSRISNTLIEMYGKCGSADDARKVFASMPESSRSPFTLFSMLVAFARNGHLREAKELFDEMPEKELSAWSALMSAYARSGHMDEAKTLFDRMPERDVISWTAMLNAYTENSLVEEAKKIFDEMPVRDVVSWTGLLVAYAQTGYVIEARRVFESMPEWDTVSANAMITAYASIQNVSEARKIFEILPAKDLVSWNATIAAYAQNGYMIEAKALFDSMPERNAISVTTMLSTYAQDRKLNLAKSLFDSMEERSTASWNAMLAAYAQNGHLEEAKIIFDTVPERCVVSWNAMVSGYAQNDRLEEARELFDRMPGRNISSWNAMLAAYAQHRDVIHAKHLFFAEIPDRGPAAWMCLILVHTYTGQIDRADKILATMPDPSAVACNAVLVAYSQIARFDRAAEIFVLMHLEDCGADETSFTCLLLGCSHSGDISRARSIFQSLALDFAKIARKQHYCGMIDVLSRAGHLCDAQELLETMPYEPDAADWRSLLKNHKRRGRCSSSSDSREDVDESSSAVRGVLVPRDAQGYILLANMFAH